MWACRGRSVAVAGGDIIIGLSGEVVSGIDDLQRVLTERIGERVEAVVLRDPRRVTLAIIMADGT